MALTKETENFVSEWKQKSASYQNHDSIDVLFQKFQALYLIYNRLFNEVSVRIGQPQKDRDGATIHVVQYLTPDALALSIEGNKETKEAAEQLKNFIRNRTYHFVLVGEQKEPSDKDDDKLLQQMKSKDNKVRMEGLLLLIYKVRCNLVHGQKRPSSAQIPLMLALIPILEVVVSKVEEKLKA